LKREREPLLWRRLRRKEFDFRVERGEVEGVRVEPSSSLRLKVLEFRLYSCDPSLLASARLEELGQPPTVVWGRISAIFPPSSAIASVWPVGGEG